MHSQNLNKTIPHNIDTVSTDIFLEQITIDKCIQIIWEKLDRVQLAMVM